MSFRTASGLANSAFLQNGHYTRVSVGVQLVRRWRFAPCAEARCQFGRAATGGRSTPRQFQVVVSGERIWRNHLASNRCGMSSKAALRSVSPLKSPLRAKRSVACPGPAAQRLCHRRGSSGIGARAPMPLPLHGQLVAHERKKRLLSSSTGRFCQQNVGQSVALFHRVQPNPSLKRSANGRPPGPVWRYAVHFRQPGPGVLPSSPA